MLSLLPSSLAEVPDDPQRASPGAEDSEAESAADADGEPPEPQGEAEAKTQGDEGGVEAESDEDEEVEELDADRYQPYMPESDEGEDEDGDVHGVHAYGDYNDDDDDESYGYGQDMYHDGPKTEQVMGCESRVEANRDCRGSQTFLRSSHGGLLWGRVSRKSALGRR